MSHCSGTHPSSSAVLLLCANCAVLLFALLFFVAPTPLCLLLFCPSSSPSPTALVLGQSVSPLIWPPTLKVLSSLKILGFFWWRQILFQPTQVLNISRPTECYNLHISFWENTSLIVRPQTWQKPGHSYSKPHILIKILHWACIRVS